MAADMTISEEEVRQILVEGSSGDSEGRALHRQTQSIRSDMATLLQLAEDQMSRLRQAADSCRGIVNEVRCSVDTFRRKETLIGRRPLPFEAEAIDIEISDLASLQKQIDTEAEAVTMRVDQEKLLFAEVGIVSPPDMQQAVDELEDVRAQITVRIVDHFRTAVFV